MNSLETERLIIRNFHDDDWVALHKMIVQYKASGMAAYDQPWPTLPEEIQKVTQWFAGGDNFLAVCLKSSDHLIGFVALNPEQETENREYNLGYIFNFDYHGKGYASEACRAILEYAFRALQAQRIVTGTAAINHASCRLLERLGFTKVAEEIGSFQTAADGTLIEFSGYRYALSRQNWESDPASAIKLL